MEKLGGPPTQGEGSDALRDFFVQDRKDLDAVRQKVAALKQEASAAPPDKSKKMLNQAGMEGHKLRLEMAGKRLEAMAKLVGVRITRMDQVPAEYEQAHEAAQASEFGCYELRNDAKVAFVIPAGEFFTGFIYDSAGRFVGHNHDYSLSELASSFGSAAR